MEAKSYEEKILTIVIKPEKTIEALGKHLKLRALGFFLSYLIGLIMFVSFLQFTNISHTFI